MNYQRHYDSLINRARNRALEGYSERHHVIPKSLGGSNSENNMASLTLKEHYLAHKLLVKIYPNSIEMKRAFFFMTNHKKYSSINGKKHEKLKIEFLKKRKQTLKERPWETSAISASTVSLNSFLFADKIYDMFVEFKEFDDSKLRRAFNLKSSSSIFKWLRNYGNPLENSNWINWISTKKRNSKDFNLIMDFTVLGPWYRHLSRNKEANVQIWVNADIFYDYWIKNSKPGYRALNEAYSSLKLDDVSEMLFKGIIKWFEENGNPKNSRAWVLFNSKHKKIDMRAILDFKYLTRCQKIGLSQIGLTKENCEWKEKAGKQIAKSLSGRTKNNFDYLRRTSERLKKLNDESVKELIKMRDENFKNSDVVDFFADKGIKIAPSTVSTVYNRNKGKLAA